MWIKLCSRFSVGEMILVSDVVERVVLIVVNVLLKCLVAVVEVSRQLVFFYPLRDIYLCSLFRESQLLWQSRST